MRKQVTNPNKEYYFPEERITFHLQGQFVRQARDQKDADN
jgi:hypothetical protein